MNILKHEHPHTLNCPGCRIMQEARESLRLSRELKDPHKIIEEGRVFDSDHNVGSNDTKVTELHSLLNEVLESPTIRPHFSPHEDILLISDDLIFRIAKALG